VSIVNSQIYSNTVPYVRADVRKFPSPQWEIADSLCLNSRVHNCEYFGQRQWVRDTQTLKTSHRPDGKVVDMLVLTLTLAQR